MRGLAERLEKSPHLWRGTAGQGSDTRDKVEVLKTKPEQKLVHGQSPNAQEEKGLTVIDMVSIENIIQVFVLPQRLTIL